MRSLFCPLRLIVLLVSATCLYSLTGCGGIILAPLSVVSSTIDDSRVTITFSSVPRRSSIIDSVQFSQDGAIVEGTFDNDGCTVCFIPFSPITEEHLYELSISTLAEDTEGRSLAEKYYKRFDKRSSSTTPTIVSITPRQESYLDSAPQQIIMSFSKTIQTQSFIKAFSISPTVEYYCTWEDEDRTVCVHFMTPLKLNTRYTVTVSPDLCDTTNNALAASFTSTFFNLLDDTIPTFILSQKTKSQEIPLQQNSLTSNISSGSTLRIAFSEAIDIDSLASHFVIKPPLSITIEKDSITKSQALISFATKPEWGTLYSFRITKGIADNSENKTSEDAEYRLCFNKESERPLTFLKGFIKTGSSTWFSFGSDNTFTQLELPVETFSTVESISVPLYLAFRISSDVPALDIVSLMKHISITSTNNCASFSIMQMKALTDDEYKASDIYSFPLTSTQSDGWHIAVVWCSVVVENELQRGIVTFSLDKECSDADGNTLPQTITLPFNKI